jgi:hypothetical protein
MALTDSYLGRSDVSRGLRNNNPLNLEISSSNWTGKIPVAQNTDGTFEQFTDIGYGLRAGAENAVNSINNNDTLAQYITVFAPPAENDTNSYINTVSADTGIAATDVLANNLDATVLASLMRAQIIVENGASNAALISDDDIAQSINLLPALILDEIGTLVKQNAVPIGLFLLGGIVIFMTAKSVSE